MKGAAPLRGRTFIPKETVDAMRKMWDEGAIARVIAARFGTTKNAVVGIARRNGFTLRASPIKRKAPSAPRAPRPVRVAPVAVPGAVEDDDVDLPPRWTVPVVPTHCCQWPFGDVSDQTLRFCGAPRDDGRSPYCEEHRRLSIQVRRSAA
jgi:hypothetical protein